jgi:lipoic acid synthetase/lipoate-protein ligase A
MIVLVLRKLGVEATSTAHNDVLVNGKKVSGTACYHLTGCSIVHGTLLYDTDMEHMLSAITPGPEKLQKKGIQSVRQRITLLKEYIPQSLDELKTLIREMLCNGERRLTEDDVAGIEQIEQTYLKEEFINLIQ